MVASIDSLLVPGTVLLLRKSKLSHCKHMSSVRGRKEEENWQRKKKKKKGRGSVERGEDQMR